jgi:hypothetical protein
VSRRSKRLKKGILLTKLCTYFCSPHDHRLVGADRVTDRHSSNSGWFSHVSFSLRCS